MCPNPCGGATFLGSSGSSACYLGGATGSIGLCFLVVCRMFVFLMSLDTRGNLDLESPEQLLTSSGTLGLGPLRAYGFWALHFCSIFRDVVLYRFFMYFRWNSTSILAPCWHHFPYVFALFFRASISHGIAINFARMFM